MADKDSVNKKQRVGEAPSDLTPVVESNVLTDEEMKMIYDTIENLVKMSTHSTDQAKTDILNSLFNVITKDSQFNEHLRTKKINEFWNFEEGVFPMQVHNSIFELSGHDLILFSKFQRELSRNFQRIQTDIQCKQYIFLQFSPFL
jgi:hypothetical protein